jgi:adenine-specific DNA-methyltransferase
MNLNEKLVSVLSTDSDLVVDGQLLKSVVIERALSLDSKLLGLLMSDSQLRKAFFESVDDTQVFDKVRFQEFVSNKEFLPDSYTAYRNYIGLSLAGDYLSSDRGVVLAWPYKDCVLAADQSTPGMSTDEQFLNVTLASDEITRLFEPKTFSRFERWTSAAATSGKSEPIEKFCVDDNLLLKGNNLLVLHSLRRRYAGRVKLIYIDPPYNTDNDDFRYNDRFKRSTWLTFMKNRLEVAKDLLSRDGSIYVNIDYNEAHYLKILMDEVFGEENFQREIIWRIGWLSGYKTTAKNFIRNHDTLLYYSKSRKHVQFNKQYIHRSQFAPRFSVSELKELTNSLEELGVDRAAAEAFLSDAQEMGLPEKYPLEDTWNASIYDKLNSIAVVSYSGEKVSKMLGVAEVKGQKSEALIQRVIEASTAPGDLVMDFFAGTGTACAVAQKLGRQWIGVEQLDYVRDTTMERLKRVLVGDGVGISKAVEWTGGGSFVYAELLMWNGAFIDRIERATTAEQIAQLAEDVRSSLHLRPGADRPVLVTDGFNDLGIREKKQILVDCLDHNHHYVNYSDIEDFEYAVSAETVFLNKAFYEDDWAQGNA